MWIRWRNIPTPIACVSAPSKVGGCAGRDPDSDRNEFAPGDTCIYIPPDAVLPPDLSDRLNVTKYLSPLAKNADGVLAARRSSARGPTTRRAVVWTHHAAGRCQSASRHRRGRTLWHHANGSRRRSRSTASPRWTHPAFHTYTDIENYRNFPDLLQDGEEVVFTEKIHGKCTRVGLIRTSEGDGEEDWTFMAGSHNLRRKEFDAKGRRSQFWDCLTEPVRQLCCMCAPCPRRGCRRACMASSYSANCTVPAYKICGTAWRTVSLFAFPIWPSTVATSISDIKQELCRPVRRRDGTDPLSVNHSAARR